MTIPAAEPRGGEPRSPDVAIEEVNAPTSREIADVRDLIEATALHDDHRPVGEHALVELKEGPKTFPHAAFLARVDGKAAGYAHLSERETKTGWRLEAFTAPEHRGRGIACSLVQTVLDHVGAHGGGRVHAWAYRPSGAQEALAAHFGMRRTRTLVRMVTELPVAVVPPPDGVTLRRFQPEDAAGWIALHNVVFADHPDAGGWRPEDLAWHLEEPWFDPRGFLIAQDADGMAGYCWMKRDGEDGWVYFLGVHSRARGSTLARAVCTAGLAWSHAEGADRGVLYVDAENVAAVNLYTGLGFRVDHTDHCYEVVVEPGPDLPHEHH